MLSAALIARIQRPDQFTPDDLDNENDTAESPGMKSHPRFHLLNLPYALARHALAPTLFVRTRAADGGKAAYPGL